MKVILIEEEAFFELVDRAVQRISGKMNADKKKWLTPKEVMKELGISSPTTLQRYRDEGRIRYSQPSKKIIRYDPESIQEFLDSKTKNTF